MDSSSQQKGDIVPIDHKSVHQICSGQVVLTLAMAVKELVENSIDAGATNIEVKLKEYGSELIEVSDNGCGIKECDFESLTLKHHTSKIEDFSDLLNVETFGFRGEALSSLCALGSLSVVTCHKDSLVGTRLEYDNDGKIAKQTPVARPIGTTVCLENLFSTLPVRHKEFHRNIKKEFGKMVNLLTAYCLISTGKRITCTNSSQKGKKTVVLSTNADNTVKGHITCIFGNKQTNTVMDFMQHKPSEAVLEEFYLTSAVNDEIYSIEGYISTPAHGSGRSTADRQFFFINGRPCDLPKVAKLINDVYHGFNKHQYPFVCFNIKVDRGCADINVTPDKRQIFVPQEKLLLAIIKTSLLGMYENQPRTVKDFSSPTLKESPKSSFGLNGSFSPKCSPVLSNLKRRISCEEGGKMPKNARLGESIGGDDGLLSSSNTMNHGYFTSAGNPSETVVCSSQLEQTESVDSGAMIEGSEEQMQDSVAVASSQSSQAPHRYQPSINSFFLNSGISQSSSINFTSTVPFKEGKVESKVKIKDFDSPDVRLTRTFSKFARDSTKTYGSQQTGSLSSPVKRGCSRKVLRKKLRTSTSEEDIDSIIQQHKIDLSNISDLTSDSHAISEVQDVACSHEMARNLETECTAESMVLGENACDEDIIDSFCVDEHHLRKRKTLLCDFSLEDIRERLKLNSPSNKDSQQPTHRKFRSRIDAEDAEAELEKEIRKDMFAKMKIIGQFNLGFIVTKLDDDLFIIDQHATDEKYNFEMLQQDTVMETQLLLNPQALELTAVSEATLIENIHIFEKNGFKFSIIDENKPGQKVQLVSVPVSQNWRFGKEDVDELIFMLGDNPGRMCRPSKICKMFASRACRKSVMIGSPLSLRIMKKLVCHMGEIEHPWNCPHGRPTMRHLFNMNLLSHR